MRFLDQWLAACRRNSSRLCLGLDPEPERLPAPWTHETSRLFDFCAAVVDATADLVCAYKPQIAHFSAVGAEAQLERLIRHIRERAPDVPVILDAKRGDIGSTARHYAREAFERYGADALTVSPFLGRDSLDPYMEAYPERGLFVLCRTSNPGSDDLQALGLRDAEQPSERLFERVARLAAGPWNRNGQLGLVTGATRPHDIVAVRAVAPDLPLLIPGVGAQGGDLEATVRAAGDRFLINASRSVLYAAPGSHFAAAARDEAERLRDTMAELAPL